MRKAVIRTSDRSTFKRCRRKWSWSSALKQNLRTKDTPSYFWIGTGGHFALEDWYGWNHFGHPVKAFQAYVDACTKFQRENGYGLPDDWEEQTTLGKAILTYYLIWIEQRQKHETVWIDGQPMVETKCEITLDIEPPPGFDVVVYQLTLDRLVVIDDEYWITDYKFFKQFKQGSLVFDQQMSAYIWGAQAIFDQPIAGAIMHEFKKTLAQEPRILSSGKISTSANQSTTHRLYRAALKNMYGEVAKAPAANVKCLNELAMAESAEGDKYIKRTMTRRNPQQMEAQGSMIMLEAHDMCNPDLPLYPNATRDCDWDCQLQDVCLQMDRDDDWDFTLKELTIPDTEEFDQWRDHLVLPQHAQQ